MRLELLVEIRAATMLYGFFTKEPFRPSQKEFRWEGKWGDGAGILINVAGTLWGLRKKYTGKRVPWSLPHRWEGFVVGLRGVGDMFFNRPEMFTFTASLAVPFNRWFGVDPNSAVTCKTGKPLFPVTKLAAANIT